MTKSIYRAYAFFVFCHLSQIIKEGFGIKIDVYPCVDEDNTVIVITFEDGEKNNIEIKEGLSLSNALVSAGVEHIFCAINGVKFEGTNTYIGSDRIVCIKENKIDFFSEDAVREDVLTLAKHRIGIA